MLIALPKIHPFSFGDEPSFEGESVSAQCHIASGDLPVSFIWLLNGKSVSHYPEISVGSFGKKMSVLSIENLSREHVGNYTCIASNPAGKSSFAAELTVKGTEASNAEYKSCDVVALFP